VASDHARAFKAGQATCADVRSVAVYCVYPTAPAVVSGSVRYGIFAARIISAWIAS
jgi:hypothetical protein